MDLYRMGVFQLKKVGKYLSYELLKEVREIIEVQQTSGKTTVELNTSALQELIEKAEKYQKIEDAWNKKDKDKDYQVIHFIRECKEVIENFKIEKRKRMT